MHTFLSVSSVERDPDWASREQVEITAMMLKEIRRERALHSLLSTPCRWAELNKTWLA